MNSPFKLNFFNVPFILQTFQTAVSCGIPPTRLMTGGAKANVRCVSAVLIIARFKLSHQNSVVKIFNNVSLPQDAHCLTLRYLHVSRMVFSPLSLHLFYCKSRDAKKKRFYLFCLSLCDVIYPEGKFPPDTFLFLSPLSDVQCIPVLDLQRNTFHRPLSIYLCFIFRVFSQNAFVKQSDKKSTYYSKPLPGRSRFNVPL